MANPPDHILEPRGIEPRFAECDSAAPGRGQGHGKGRGADIAAIVAAAIAQGRHSTTHLSVCGGCGRWTGSLWHRTEDGRMLCFGCAIACARAGAVEGAGAGAGAGVIGEVSRER